MMKMKMKIVEVYPACAGIDLSLEFVLLELVGLPRMRGDRPLAAWAVTAEKMFTPHARGSTVLWSPRRYGRTVYPACAGIDHGLSAVSLVIFRLPRMRGDRPDDSGKTGRLYRFTPHARGSTWRSQSFLSI